MDHCSTVIEMNLRATRSLWYAGVCGNDHMFDSTHKICTMCIVQCYFTRHAQNKSFSPYVDQIIEWLGVKVCNIYSCSFFYSDSDAFELIKENSVRLRFSIKSRFFSCFCCKSTLKFLKFYNKDFFAMTGTRRLDLVTFFFL